MFCDSYLDRHQHTIHADFIPNLERLKPELEALGFSFIQRQKFSVDFTRKSLTCRIRVDRDKTYCEIVSFNKRSLTARSKSRKGSMSEILKFVRETLIPCPILET